MIPSSQETRLPLAVLSVGACAIHLAVIGPHFQESLLAGSFFLVLAAFQIGWAALSRFRFDRVVVASAIIVNLLVVGVWAWSRTTGLPLGLSEGPEPVGLADLVATGFEVALVIGSAITVIKGAPTLRVPTAVSWAVVVLTALLTVFAVFGGFGFPAAYEHHEEQTPGSHTEHEEESGESVPTQETTAPDETS